MFWIITVAVAALDQISKLIVARGMELESTVELIPGVLDLTYIRNDGAAWGILSGRQTLLIVTTSIVLAAICVYVLKYSSKLNRAELVSLALIAGGGIGNLISRAFEHGVVDFLNIHIIPIFNVADIGVTVGCILLMISLFRADNGKTDI